MKEGGGCLWGIERKESVPPGQIKEGFTEEATLKPSLKGLAGVRQGDVGERAFEAKDSGAKASEAGCGLGTGWGSEELGGWVGLQAPGRFPERLNL